MDFGIIPTRNIVARFKQQYNCCDILKFQHGEITCRPVECERVECKNPVLHPGECCPTCLRKFCTHSLRWKRYMESVYLQFIIFPTISGQCLLKQTLYEHGDRFVPKECAECVCHDGNMQCTRADPNTTCPPLPCEKSLQFTVPGECCKFCPGKNIILLLLLTRLMVDVLIECIDD